MQASDQRSDLMRPATTLIFMIFLALLPQAPARADLPDLNQGSYGGMTLNTEYQLGRNFVRSLRRQAPLMRDPAGSWYLEQLVWQLAGHSQLDDTRLEIIGLDNPQFNAFAVPGGIVGLNGGLLLSAHNEGELASVVAHELAHLSQRHFASQMEQQRQSKPLMLAGMLAGILLSSVSGDAATATITSTLAASSSAQLAFSRRNEQEADRIGMQTLVDSGYNPHAMPKMFGRLLDNYRYASRPPEFLSTHPLSKNRIADSQGRAAQLTGNDSTPFKDPLLFGLVKARLTASYDSNPTRLAQTLAGEQQSASGKQHRMLGYARYVARIKAGQQDHANKAWQQLDTKLQRHWLVQQTRAEQLMDAQQPGKAVQLLKSQLALYPDNYPLQQRLAEALHQNNQIKASLKLYRKLAMKRPTDVHLHYQLAELYGLAGDKHGVHKARTEYFMLVGNIDKALRQIKFGRREKGLSPADTQQLDQLEREAKAIREQMKQTF